MNSPETQSRPLVRRMVGAVRPHLIPLVAVCLIGGGFGMRALARYKIRAICQHYPIEIQMRDFPACVHYGGPWPQKTNAPNARPDTARP